MRHPIGLELLRGDTSVDIEAMRRAVTVDLASDDDEAKYQQQDWRLHVQVQQVAAAELGTERAQELVTVHDDWSPNRTKSLSLEVSAVSPSLLATLQALLQGEHKDWCLAIEVCKRSGDTETEVGPVRIYAKDVFAVQALAPQVAGGA